MVGSTRCVEAALISSQSRGLWPRSSPRSTVERLPRGGARVRACMRARMRGCARARDKVARGVAVAVRAGNRD